MGFFMRRRKAEAQRQTNSNESERVAQERELLRKQVAERKAQRDLERARRQSPTILPDPTRPQSSLLIPKHLLDRAEHARRRAAGLDAHMDAQEEFADDLRRIYPPSKRDRSVPTLIRMFQSDWNNDSLPLKGIREVINLPNLMVDGIADARTQHAVTAYRRLTDPDSLEKTASEILDGFQHDVDTMPPEAPVMPPEEIVDDLQDLLDELDDDPTT